MKSLYQKQTQMVVEVLPLLQDKSFALKGGTAINLFFRDLPRLSVDIDLTYLPIEERNVSFQSIHEYLQKTIQTLKKRGFECKSDKPLDGKTEVKLVAWRNETQIKIEPNFTIRGAVKAPQIREVSTKVKEAFGSNLQVNCLSFEDTFGGKICAALTRQHPRDLFDVRLLLDNEGITDELKTVFMYYLLSSPKPFFEVLMPRNQPIDVLYADKFEGMSDEPITTSLLTGTLVELTCELRRKFTEDDLDFLKSLLTLKPQWDLIAIPNLKDFPSVRWRLLNIEKMDAFKRTMEIKKLDEFWAK